MIGVFQLPTTLGAATYLVIGLLVWAVTEGVGNVLMDRVLGEVFRPYVGRVPYGSTYKHLIEHLLDVGKNRYYTYAFYSSFVAGVGEELMWFGAPMVVGLYVTSGSLPATVGLMTAAALVWAGIHSMNYFDAARAVGLYRYRWRAFWGAMAYYVPASVGSMTLWLLGFGYVSMLLHTMHDLSISLREARNMRTRARLMREHARGGRKRVNPYAGESFVE